MKKAFLLVLLFSSFFVDAQSLKEALFSGKLKNEPGMVIRKGDDLSTFIDTTTRTAPARDTIAVINVAKTGNGAAQQGMVPKATTTADSARMTASASTNATSVEAAASADGEADDEAADAETANEPAVKAKSNTVLWKEYITNLVPTLKSEVLSSKKVKKGSYYVLLSYAIDTDGQTTITDVFVSPENKFLQEQISQRITLETPKLAPVLNSAGNARKVNKKYNFTIEKE